MTDDKLSLAALTNSEISPHHQELLDFLSANEDRVIPLVMAKMEQINRSFGKLNERASTLDASALGLFHDLLHKVGISMHKFDKKAARIRAAAERKRRVAVTYTAPTRAERRENHAIRMNMRKDALAERTEGFDPVSSRRVTSLYQTIRAGMHMQNSFIDPMTSHNEAMKEVRRRLPADRRDMFSLRADKSRQTNQPDYCKPNVQPKSSRVAA